MLNTESKLVKDESNKFLRKDDLLIVEKLRTYKDNVIDSMLIVEKDRDCIMLNDHKVC